MNLLSKREIKNIKLIKSIGVGAFKKLEIDNGGGINLRVLDIRRYDGAARLEFDKNRSEIVTGRTTSAIGPRRPFWLVRGDTYKICTQIIFAEPIPEGIWTVIYPGKQLKEVGAFVQGGLIESGFEGQIKVNLLVTMRFQIEEMYSIGKMYFMDRGESGSKKEAKSKKGKKESVQEIKSEREESESVEA